MEYGEPLFWTFLIGILIFYSHFLIFALANFILIQQAYKRLGPQAEKTYVCVATTEPFHRNHEDRLAG